MLKKIGMSALLLATVLLQPISNTSATATTFTATSPCGSISECREMAREARENIAEIIEEEEELSEEIAVIQANIARYRSEISVLTTEINELEAEIRELQEETAALLIEVEENIAIQEENEARIEVLFDEIAQRMRVAQRMNNRNTIITLLSEADSLINFMRVARTFTEMATRDAELMQELTDLVAQQEEIVKTLAYQIEIVETNREILQENQAVHEVEHARLVTLQEAQTANEYELLRQMYELGLNRIDEEERLAVIEDAEEILRNTPAPPVRVQTPPSTNTNNNSTGGSSSTPAAPPAASTGLAHPLPGARVSSPFGPRWGGHHAGIDVEIFVQPSAPILASASGTVTVATYGSGMGWYVVISHNINGQRVDTLYAHLRYQPMVSVGEVVSQGQQIGNKGSTGFSTGAHLHFEVHPGGFQWNQGVDPAHWVNF